MYTIEQGLAEAAPVDLDSTALDQWQMSLSARGGSMTTAGKVLQISVGFVRKIDSIKSDEGGVDLTGKV